MEEEKSNSSSVGEGRGSEASKRAAKMSRLAELSKASAREATRASEAATIAADALQMEAGRIIEAGEAPEAAVIQALEIARLQSRQLSAVAEAAATTAVSTSKRVIFLREEGKGDPALIEAARIDRDLAVREAAIARDSAAREVRTARESIARIRAGQYTLLSDGYETDETTIDTVSSSPSLNSLSGEEINLLLRQLGSSSRPEMTTTDEPSYPLENFLNSLAQLKPRQESSDSRRDPARQENQRPLPRSRSM